MRKLPTPYSTTPVVLLIHLCSQLLNDEAAKDRQAKGQEEISPTFRKIYANFSFHDDLI